MVSSRILTFERTGCTRDYRFICFFYLGEIQEDRSKIVMNLSKKKTREEEENHISF